MKKTHKGPTNKVQGLPGSGTAIRNAIASHQRLTQGKQTRTTRSKDGRASGNIAKAQGKKDQVGGYTSSDLLAYPSNVLSFGKNREALGHAAAYPVRLPEFFILACSDEGDAIYDPFMGSGTTIIAAERLGRKCYGMEISPGYCDIIIQRWEDHTGKTAVLIAG